MITNWFRAVFLGAALLVSATTVGFADDPTPALPNDIQTLINNAAAQNSDPTTYAQAIAAIVSAHQDLAAQIAGQAVAAKSGASNFAAFATSIATSVAAVAPPAVAASVVNAIVAQVPVEQKASIGTIIVSNYIAAAPPAAVQTIALALAPVLNTITQSAAGNQSNATAIANAIIQNTINHPSAG